MPSTNAPRKDTINRNQRRNLNREKAREQARLLKEQEEAKRKRTRIIAGVAGVAIIAAVIALTVILVKNTDTPIPSTKGSDGLAHSEKVITAQAPANVTEYGGISLGKELVAGTKNEGVPQVDIYFDYACPACNLLGNEYGAALGEAAKRGDITLVYHPVRIHSIPFASTGAGAEFFIAENEPDKYFAFHELVHEKLMTPYLEEKISAPTAKDVVDIAREAGVSEENCEKLLQELTQMETALEDEDVASSPLLTWIVETTEQFAVDSQLSRTDGNYGTPSVYIDGVMSDKWSTDIPDLLDK